MVKSSSLGSGRRRKVVINLWISTIHTYTLKLLLHVCMISQCTRLGQSTSKRRPSVNISLLSLFHPVLVCSLFTYFLSLYTSPIQPVFCLSSSSTTWTPESHFPQSPSLHTSLDSLILCQTVHCAFFSTALQALCYLAVSPHFDFMPTVWILFLCLTPCGYLFSWFWFLPVFDFSFWSSLPVQLTSVIKK